MKSMETGRQDGGSDKNHAPFSVGKTGNISRKFLTIILKIFDKNFERLQWNFTKFLISKDGDMVERFEPTQGMKIVKEKIQEVIRSYE